MKKIALFLIFVFSSFYIFGASKDEKKGPKLPELAQLKAVHTLFKSEKYTQYKVKLKALEGKKHLAILESQTLTTQQVSENEAIDKEIVGLRSSPLGREIEEQRVLLGKPLLEYPCTYVRTKLGTLEGVFGQEPASVFALTKPIEHTP
jgi:hypothetical protein